MNQVQKLSSFILTIALAISIFIWLALPYPWTPFGQWLESLIRDIDSCTCFWPWWLFFFGSLSLTFAISCIYRYLKLPRAWLYSVSGMLNAALVIYHWLARGYFLKLKICEDSVYSDWLWLCMLISTVIIVFLLKHPRKHN